MEEVRGNKRIVRQPGKGIGRQGGDGKRGMTDKDQIHLENREAAEDL